LGASGYIQKTIAPAVWLLAKGHLLTMGQDAMHFCNAVKYAKFKKLLDFAQKPPGFLLNSA